MATEKKRVTLHPLKSDGTLNTKVNLYPKTFLDGIVDRNGNPVDIQTLLVAGENITIENGVISAAGNLKTTEIDLASLMSQEEILSLVQYLAGLDEELEKEFLFSELIHVSDYLEYSQIKLQYSLSGGEPSGIILNKKYETEGEPQFIYEDLEAGITLKLFDGGLTASRAIPVDAYTKEESDAKYLTTDNATSTYLKITDAAIYYQEKLTPGNNITINENNVISATGDVTEEELQQAIDDVTTELETKIDAVDAKVDNVDDKLNENVLLENGNKISYNGDTVTLTLSNKNLKTGVSGSNAEVIELADEDTAGLMSYTDYNTLWSLVDRVSALEGTKVRIAYTTSSNPTAAQIKAFVDEYFAERGKQSPTDEDYNSVSVVIDSTKHIWNYYANNQAYKDDGLDTVNQFTNETAGIIKGKNTDGFVYAETDGTGSVYGWDVLKTRVGNLESENDTQNQEITALQNNKVDNTTFEQDISDLQDDINNGLATKQDTLVSGTNIKTINSNSILGSGNIEISGGKPQASDFEAGEGIIIEDLVTNKVLIQLDPEMFATEDDIYKAMGILNLDDEEIDTSDNSLVLSDKDTVDEDNHIADLDNLTQ